MTRRDEQTLRCDRLARELPNRIALVAGGLGDPGEAEQVCRDLHELLEGDYALRFRWDGAEPARAAQVTRRRDSVADGPEGVTRPENASTRQLAPPAGAAFVGRVIATKFATACKVCRVPLPAGAEVIWQQGVGCACVSCGEVAA